MSWVVAHRSGLWVGVVGQGQGRGLWVGVVVQGQGRESGLWVGVGAVGHGLCVGVVGRGRSHGLWVVGQTEVPFVPARAGFWQSALGGVAVPRGALALQPLGGWPGPWHRASGPSLLPARPPAKQASGAVGWAPGAGPCPSDTGAEDPEPGKLLHAV